MKYDIFQVDTFSKNIFGGNPAAVVPLKEWLPKKVMQSIANENNLSETAFFVPNGKEFEIRWFTPIVEIPLCGHATLASAFVIFNHPGYSQSEINFISQSGKLSVKREKKILYLNFPRNNPTLVEPDELLNNVFGKRVSELYKFENDYLAIFKKQSEIESLKPNFNKLSQLKQRAIIVSTKGKSVDFVSRFFAPKLGIDEDPVTGYAQTILIPFWSKRLNKKALLANQLSKRGGQIFCKDLGNRVEIGGYAKTYLIGKINL